MDINKILKIGMIGAGRIAKIHANNITHLIPDAEVAAVCDKFVNPAVEMAEQLHICDV